MTELTYTLLADGSSDQALMPILTWLLRAQGLKRAIQPEWADLRYLPRPPRTLPARIDRALELYPCEAVAPPASRPQPWTGVAVDYSRSGWHMPHARRRSRPLCSGRRARPGPAYDELG